MTEQRSAAINAQEPPAATAWPKQPPGADELIRYATGRAMWLNGSGWGYVEAGMFESDDPTLREWHLNATTQMIHLHDIVLLLREIKAVDAQRADRAAEWIWTAAAAGDSYGEWLWQWAAEAGHEDPDALCEAGKAAAEGRITVARERPTDPPDSGSSPTDAPS